MGIRRCVLTCLVVTVAGCGGQAGARPPLLEIARPSEPVWCPPNRGEGFDVRRVLGLTESDAAMAIASHGCTTRVVVVDGRHLRVTSDLVRNRVDLRLNHDMVTAVGIG